MTIADRQAAWDLSRREHGQEPWIDEVDRLEYLATRPVLVLGCSGLDDDTAAAALVEVRRGEGPTDRRPLRTHAVVWVETMGGAFVDRVARVAALADRVSQLGRLSIVADVSRLPDPMRRYASRAASIRAGASIDDARAMLRIAAGQGRVGVVPTVTDAAELSGDLAKMTGHVLVDAVALAVARAERVTMLGELLDTRLGDGVRRRRFVS